MSVSAYYCHADWDLCYTVFSSRRFQSIAVLTTCRPYLDCVLCCWYCWYECHHATINTEVTPELCHPAAIKVPASNSTYISEQEADQAQLRLCCNAVCSFIQFSDSTVVLGSSRTTQKMGQFFGLGRPAMTGAHVSAPPYSSTCCYCVHKRAILCMPSLPGYMAGCEQCRYQIISAVEL